MQISGDGLANFIGREKYPCDVSLWLALLYLPLAAGPTASRIVLTMYRVRFGKLIYEDFDQSEVDIDPDFYEMGSFPAQIRAFIKSFFTCSCDTVRVIDSFNDIKPRLPRSRLMSRAFAYSVSSSSTGEGKVVSQTSTIPEQVTVLARPRRLSHTQAMFFGKSSAYGFILQIVITAVCIAIGVVLSIKSDSPFGGKGCYGCTINGWIFIALVVTGAIVVAIVLPGTIILRNVHDSIGIARELRLLMVCGIFVLLGVLLSMHDPGNARAEGKFDWLYIVSIAGIAVHWLDCVHPVYLTYRDTQLRLTHKDSTTLSMVLKDPEAKQIFQAYLITEWSSENGLFLDAVRRFRTMHELAATPDLVLRAVDMFNTFIKEGAILEINVPASIRRTLRLTIEPWQTFIENDSPFLATMEKPDIGLFDEAYEEIYMLVETDSFPRFQRSNMYAEAKQSLRSNNSVA